MTEGWQDDQASQTKHQETQDSGIAEDREQSNDGAASGGPAAMLAQIWSRKPMGATVVLALVTALSVLVCGVMTTLYVRESNQRSDLERQNRMRAAQVRSIQSDLNQSKGLIRDLQTRLVESDSRSFDKATYEQVKLCLELGKRFERAASTYMNSEAAADRDQVAAVTLMFVNLQACTKATAVKG